MPIFNDPGVYVVQEIIPRAADVVLGEMPAAFVGPLFQIVDQHDDTETDLELDDQTLDDLSDVTVPYPNIKHEDNPVDEDSVEVYLMRRDGRSETIPGEYLTITPEEVTVSLKDEDEDTTIGSFYQNLNDEWLGKEVEYTGTDDNLGGLEGSIVHVSYRSVREDLVGRVVLAQGQPDTEVQLGKATPENPLGMAGGIASNVAPTETVAYVPTKDYLTEVSTDTVDAESEVTAGLARLEPKTVYEVVVLSDDLNLQGNVVNHVENMSDPAEGQYRFGWLPTEMPDESAVRDYLDIGEEDELTEVSKKEAQKDILASEATGIFNRRAALLFQPFDLEIDGELRDLESYYLAVGYAALNASLPTQQGLTNYPLSGVVNELKYGKDYFKPSQLSELSNAGVFTCIQDVPGAPIRSRAQFSTNTLNNETKQISITNLADEFSYTLINTLERFIGVTNINDDVLETLEDTINALINTKKRAGKLNSGNLVKLEENPDAKYRVDVEIEATFPSPLDQIVVTLKY